ncbi:MAG: PAS domain S-box protein [Bacteroidota bacterium]
METYTPSYPEKDFDFLVNLPVGLILYDNTGDIISVNPAAEQILGLSSSHITGWPKTKLQWEVVHEDLSSFKSEDHPAMVALRTGKKVKGEIMGIRRLGEENIIWLKVDAVPKFREKESRPFLVYVILQDITDLFNSRLLLQQSEENYKVLVDNMHSALMILQDGHIRYVNRSLEEKSGYKLEELLGESFLSFVHPDERKKVEEYYKSRLSGKQVPDTYKSRTRIRDGSYLHVDVRVKAIRFRGKPAVLVVMNDVDAMVKAEEALKVREKHLRTIYNTVGNIIVVFNVGDGNDLRFTSVNDEFYRVTGLDPEGVLGRQLTDLMPGPTVSSLLDNCWLAIHEKRTVRWEEHLVLPGADFFALVAFSPVFNEAGKCTSVVGSIHNITERVEAENRLLESEMKFRNMFENHVAVKLLLDASSGQILEANEAAEHFYGWSREELCSMNIAEINQLEEDKIRGYMSMAISGDKRSFTFRHRLKSGETRDVEVYSSKILFEDREVLYSIIIDITDKKKYEERLKLYSTAIEQSPESIMIIDLKGNVDFVNPMFVRTTGYEKEEVIGKPLRQFLATQDENSFLSMWNTINEGKNWYGEMESVSKNGLPYHEKISASSISGIDGRISYFFIVRKDISEELKIRESLLEAKEQAEESDRLKSAFLATMSHELRTPLNAVLGFSDVIRERAGDEEISRFADIIFKSGKGLLEIIEDILDLARIERDRINVRAQQMEIGELYNDLRKHLEENLLESGKQGQILPVFSALPGHLKRKMTTDRNKVAQVMINLVKNAVKYTDKGAIELGVDLESGRDAVFFVKDTGIGIPREKQQVIFEFFRQGDDSHTRKYGGLGIGLAISNRIAHALGGRIELESEPGKGSVFRFVLPGIVESDGESGPYSGFQVPDLSSVEILAAEDDPTNMIYLEELIALSGARLIRVFNGQEAVEYVQNKMPDMVLMDMKMPVMDGFEATRVIKALNRQLPVIALTAYAYKNDRDKALHCGCDDVLVKPVNRQQLYDCIGKILNGTLSTVKE